MYLKGILKGSNSISVNVTNMSTNRLSVTSGASVFKGIIDDVSIWNRSLSAAEIRQLYYAGAGRDGTELNSSLTEEGENYSVMITPFDFSDWGSGVNSSILEIIELIPVLISPSDGDTDNNLTQAFVLDRK